MLATKAAVSSRPAWRTLRASWQPAWADHPCPAHAMHSAHDTHACKKQRYCEHITSPLPNTLSNALAAIHDNQVPSLTQNKPAKPGQTFKNSGLRSPSSTHRPTTHVARPRCARCCGLSQRGRQCLCMPRLPRLCSEPRLTSETLLPEPLDPVLPSLSSAASTCCTHLR